MEVNRSPPAKRLCVFLKDFHRRIKSCSTAMESLEIKDINVVLMHLFFAISRSAVPPLIFALWTLSGTHASQHRFFSLLNTVKGTVWLLFRNLRSV